MLLLFSPCTSSTFLLLFFLISSSVSSIFSFSFHLLFLLLLPLPFPFCSAVPEKTAKMHQILDYRDNLLKIKKNKSLCKSLHYDYSINYKIVSACLISLQFTEIWHDLAYLAHRKKLLIAHCVRFSRHCSCK
jgi:hypothetical protein